MTPAARNKLQQLREEIEFLETKSSDIQVDEELSRREPGYTIQKSFEVAIESALDIGRRILAENTIPQPEENREVFSKLAENNLISPDNLENYQKMASFRNVLVHEYIKIDSSEVFKALRNLEDLKNLAKELSKAMEKSS
ncbi:MAG: DUF86 domain-containing protein [Clostridiales bacterium]|nr:DUF86 domain-containing protein [Clostridiales bacterium]